MFGVLTTMPTNCLSVWNSGVDAVGGRGQGAQRPAEAASEAQEECAKWVRRLEKMGREVMSQGVMTAYSQS